jgi:dipeptidyl-peptidase-4
MPNMLPLSVLTLVLALPLLDAASQDEVVREMVLNAQVDAHWSDDSSTCWYRQQTAIGQYRFLRVTPGTGSQAPAFDHELMAQALAAALGMPVTANALPITDLAFPDGATVLVSAGGHWWATTPGQHLTETTHAAPPQWLEEERPTTMTGAEMTLTINNRTTTPLSLSWIGFTGEEKRYASIEPGATHRQNTFAGHVWKLASADGSSWGVVEAGGGGSDLAIDGALPQHRIDANRSPDGRWLAVIRQDNLCLEPIAGGALLVLTHDGTREDRYELPACWSPDSALVVAWRTRIGDRRTISLIESSPADQLQPKVHVIPYPKPGDRVDYHRPILCRVAERMQVTVDDSLFENPWSIHDCAWNRDGTAFSVLFNQRGHQLMRVVEIDRNGNARTLIEERARTFIDYSGKCYLKRLQARNELLWMSERDGWNHLWRYDGRTGRVINQITRGTWVVRSVERVDEQAGLIWFTAGGIIPGEDPYQLHHARIAFDGSGLTLLTRGDGTHQATWSPDRHWLIDSWSRVDAPAIHVLRNGATGEQVLELGAASIDALRATGWQMPERFSAKGRDGATDIYGVIWRPHGFDPAKRYPVVESIYAGPQSASVPKAFTSSYPQQAIADAGFVVAMIDGMGTSLRSKAFHDLCWKNLADAGLPDRILWWKAAAATRPWMDLSRVGIYGGSAGGQNAMGALLRHPEFYQVGVADCGCHDNRMDKMWWNEQWMGWPIGPHYAEQSNVTQAHRLQGRLMLIVGELDDNVDPQSTFQVAHALEQSGKEFELVVIQGQGHGAAETPYGSRKRLEFLQQNLGGAR